MNGWAFYCRSCGLAGNPTVVCRCGSRRYTTNPAAPALAGTMNVEVLPPALLPPLERLHNTYEPPPAPPREPTVPFVLTDVDRVILVHLGYPIDFMADAS